MIAACRQALWGLLLLLLFGATARADEGAIRKNLATRIPDLPKIDEVTPTAMPGLFEVRMGKELIYTDSEGNYILQGDLLDTRERKNLTEEHLDKLTAVKFKDLPFQNAIKIVRGAGKRQLALFEDPNCPYCKRFEQDLIKVDNITVSVFVLPILGADSKVMSEQVWCSKDRAAAWLGWMVHGAIPSGPGKCDVSALKANVSFAHEHNLTSTPTLIFTSGRRIEGQVSLEHLEKLLQ